jgi:hypothetical protein
VTVSYSDKSTTVSVYSPLITNGDYVGSVEEIQNTISKFASSKVSGFSGFSLDPETGGRYEISGVSGQDMSVSFTRREGSENIAVEGAEIPDAVILTSIMPSSNLSVDVDTYINMGASIYCALDPSIASDTAYENLRQYMSSAIDNAQGSFGTYVTTAGEFKITTTVLAANGKYLLIYSFQEP